MKNLAVLGDRNPQFITHRELDAALALLPDGIDAKWIGTDTPDAARRAAKADAVWVVSGSPYRNDEVVYEAIQNARLNGQPFLGTCAGFQYAVVEFAKNAAGIAAAAHAETAHGHGDLVVERLTCSLIGEERKVTAIPGTRLYDLMGPEPFTGFHWCNYGLAPAYADQLTQRGLVISARAGDAGAEAIEIPGHPFFLATLFQPQVGSLAGKPLSPIIRAFLAA
jgi:CTP synthase (UTP-ammonia lyase)